MRILALDADEVQRASADTDERERLALADAEAIHTALTLASWHARRLRELHHVGKKPSPFLTRLAELCAGYLDTKVWDRALARFRRTTSCE